ncbi:DoxX family protein [Streptomyces roseicoloratus]|uniref:DoxX family protein n=1 Tax=Streptomyces roseicoloratus TaxID=2508722 RepID=A0ABY9RT13_9ACTN|nr:DoxX family protein [Streptomyces roseicoloratus]WMX44369.1 DoxX family protein [Streptomyces roseicoloratus]
MTVSSQLRPTRTTSRPTAPRPAGRYDRLAPRLHHYGLVLLRAGLGGVFVWFGVLKVMDLSPAAELVVAVIPFETGAWFVPALGWAEIVLGAWLLTGRAPALLLPVLGGHLLGTFAVLVLTPHLAFDHGNPVLLTLVGEFVVKNVVLLAAAVVLTTRPRAE